MATKAGSKKGDSRNPERQLIRHQFLEILVRLSVTKYVKTGTCKSISEAVDKLFREHLDKFFAEFDSNLFRETKLWQEDSDKVVKRNLPVIKLAYTRYSGDLAMPGQTKYMSLQEFTELVLDSGVVNEKFGEREIKPIYSVSMMTQRNEITSDKL